MLSEVPRSARRVSPPIHRRYWLSLYRRDVSAAERIVESLLHDWPPTRIYLRLFEPALALSGTLWARGRITYQDEHFVTHHTLRFMRRVRRQFVRPDASGPLAVATVIGQQGHLIGLQMVCDFLQWANWRVHWLSSNDRGVAGAAVARLNPDAVLLSVVLADGVVPAARLIQDLRRRRGYRGLVVVGGRALNCDPSLVARIGADLTATNGAALIRALRPHFPQMGRVRAADANLAGG